MLTTSTYKADVDKGVKDTLEWNQRSALSSFLAMEDHMSQITEEEIPHSWCIIKHHLVGCDHHVREAIGHMERLGRDSSKYRAFHNKLMSLDVYPEPKITLSELVELRTEWRYIIDDPTLTGECEICDKDITPTIKRLISRKQLKEYNKDYNNPNPHNTLRKTLYSKHTYKNSDKRMDQKEVGTVLAGSSLGVVAHQTLIALDARYPLWPVKPSLVGDLAGLGLAIYGGLNFSAPYDLLAATIGSYVATDLFRYIENLTGPAVRVATVSPRVAVTPTKVAYTTQNSVVVKPTALMNQGRYLVS